MDMVFRSVRKIYNSTLIQISLVISLYVIYVFCVFSLSDNLIGAICYEYSLPLFISTYFFRTYGKYLILLTPILLKLIVKISHIEITATFPQLLMKSGIIFCLFLFVEWGNPVVSSDKEAVDSYLIGYVGKYYLYSPIADGYENFIMDDDEFLELLSSYDKVVILEEHYTLNVMTKKLFNHTYPIGVYSVEEILVNK